jgi:hypothetical protein
LFLIFNRPKTTQQVFDAIRKARPSKLYVAADGPRKNRAGEKELCEETRAIIKQVDWPCKVKKLFRKDNLGCGIAVSSAITWFFKNEEMGIILEDDCLPDKTFFSFCTQLLDKYKNDERIMLVSGDNFISDKVKLNESYYFSRYFHIWGWASWRRAWKNYDYNMASWPDFRKNKCLNSFFSSFEERSFWEGTFDLAYQHKIHSWDAQLEYSFLLKNGYSIYPSVNLISNIGFGADSTHTSGENNHLSKMKINSFGKLVHPLEVKESIDIDYIDYKMAFNFSRLNISYLWFLRKFKNLLAKFGLINDRFER